jgi:hypothetical protein
MLGSARYDPIPSQEAQAEPSKKYSLYLRVVAVPFFFLSLLYLAFIFISAAYNSTEETSHPMIVLASTKEFDDLGRYICRDYDVKSPFSSFLPGLAGLWGIPMSVPHNTQ